jgi:ABC-type nickel/cobalt efflux system permease component RcnA
MIGTGPLLLIGAVAAVGVLHTLVPDHWMPIALLSRQRGWSRMETARTAAIAGLGHTLSTLAIGAILWIGGFLLAQRAGHIMSQIASIALVTFGAWVAIGALRELHGASDDGHAHLGHRHLHQHADGTRHSHWHEHHDDDWHDTTSSIETSPPTHEHAHDASSRTALLLILGSSPMIEGLPAFFAASRYGVWQLVAMAFVFAIATIVTYVATVVAGAAGLERANIGPLERYGEVLSGAVIAALGIVFLFVSL